MPVYKPDKNCKINNEKSIKRFEKLLESGRHIETACELVGISKTVFYACINEWEIHNNEDFREFAQRIKAARARFQQKAEEKLNSLALEEGDSKALMYLLSRRFPKHWGENASDRKAETIVLNLLSILKTSLNQEQYENILQNIQGLDLENEID